MKDYAKEAIELVCSESEIVRDFLRGWEIKTGVKVVDLYSILPEVKNKFWQWEVMKHARAKSESCIDYKKKLLKFEIWFNQSYIENHDLPMEVLSLHEFFHEVLKLVRPKNFRYVSKPRRFPSPRLRNFTISQLADEFWFLQHFDVHPFNKPTPYHLAGICVGENVSGKEILRRLHEIGEVETAVNFDFFVHDEEIFVNHLAFTVFDSKKKEALKAYTDEAKRLVKNIISLKEIKYELKKADRDYFICERVSKDARILDGLYIRFMKDICYIYGIFSSELSRDVDEELKSYAMRERDYFVEERLKPKYKEVKEYCTKKILQNFK